MSPLDSFWNGVLSVLTPIVTPDWGKLITLIPWLLLLLVLGFLALIARAWVRLLRSEPVRGPKVRQRSLRPMLLGHGSVVVLGVLTVIAAFIAGSRDPSWDGRNSPVGLLVSFPLLVLGLGLVIGAVGNGIRLWDRNGRDDVEPDLIDHANAAIRRHPDRARRLVTFVAGAIIAALGMALGTVPGYTGGDPMAVAVIPVLLLGLALAVGTVGSAIAAVWRHDPDFDPPATDESSALVPAHR